MLANQPLPPQPPREIGRALRVQEDQHPELLGLGPERVELRIGELVVGHRRAHRGAAQPKLLDGVLQLLRRELGKLERDRRERDEAVRVGGAVLGEALVLDAHHPLGERRAPRHTRSG